DASSGRTLRVSVLRCEHCPPVALRRNTFSFILTPDDPARMGDVGENMSQMASAGRKSGMTPLEHAPEKHRQASEISRLRRREESAASRRSSSLCLHRLHGPSDSAGYWNSIRSV